MSHELHRLAFISTHTSPLAQPGTTKAGGMNVYIRELTRQLGHLGYQVDIFTRRDDPDAPEEVRCADNVSVLNVTAGPPAPLDREAVYALVPEFTAAVRGLIARRGAAYDLVHSHYWLSGLTAAELADAWQRPHLAMFHTLGAVKNRARRGERESALRIAQEQRLVARADHLICATPHEREFLANLYGADPRRVSVVPGGVDLAQFSPADPGTARRRLGLAGGPVVLFVGRLEPLKGADILLQAAAIAEVDRPLTLLIVGGDGRAGATGGEQERLQRLAAELGIVAQVRFVGPVDRSLLPTYYRAADVCVVPSYYESFGLVAVEALASGVPVIATRVGGLSYTVQDGRTGYLVPWRCAEPFAERLEVLLANADLRARFRRAARDSVRQFAWSAVAARVAAVYESLLAPHDALPCCGGHHVHSGGLVAGACCHPH